MERKKLIQKLKNLINHSSFLSDFNKLDWIKSLESLNIDELKEAYNFFSKSKDKLEDVKYKILLKTNLEDNYKKELIKISNTIKKKAIIKQEQKRNSNNDNNNILKKLFNS